MTDQPIDKPGTPCAGGVAAVLVQMQAQVRPLTETLWAAHDTGELMDGVAALETLKSTLDALELGIVHELEVTGGIKSLGWASAQEFLTWVAGEHKATGASTVRLAAAVDTALLAPVGEAMTQGWLSTAKAQVIRNAIDRLPGDRGLRERGVAAMLVESRRLDATELRKLARHLISVVDPEGDHRRAEKELDREERAAHLDRALSIRDDGAGGAFISGHCSSEDAAEIRSTLLPLSKPEPAEGPTCDPATCQVPGCGHDGRDPRDHGARTLDALVDLCRRAKTQGLLPECHGTTPRVSVSIDLDALRNGTGFGDTETGETLSATTIRRMCCDADVIPVVLGTVGEVLDVGRQQRLVTPAIWKALVVRDQHCRFPHCTRPPLMTHAHHIVHWANGGPTSLDNLILVCGHHHRLIHAGPWGIRRTGPTTFDFDPPPGTRRWARHLPPTNDPP